MTAKWPQMNRSLVAILRGIKPEEAEDIATALMEAGFEAIEVPLNSPDAFTSIKTMVNIAPEKVWIGAGTVLSIEQVERLNNVGGRLMVSPNVEPDVIRKAASYGMLTMPGVFTATEALAAIKAGATGLKFFPASALGPGGIKAISAILPANFTLGAVGGVSEADFDAYAAVGVRTFGMGSSLYAPGFSAEQVAEKAKTVISAYDAVFN